MNVNYFFILLTVIIVIILILVNNPEYFEPMKNENMPEAQPTSLDILDISNDPAIEIFLNFIGSFKKYEEYRTQTDLKPEKSYYWWMNNETREGGYNDVIRAATDPIPLTFEIQDQYLRASFNLIGHENIFNAFCNTIGKSSYHQEKDKGISLLWFDDKVKDFWCNAGVMPIDIRVDTDDSVRTISIRCLEMMQQLKYKNNDYRYLMAMLEKAKEQYPEAECKKEKGKGKISFPIKR